MVLSFHLKVYPHLIFLRDGNFHGPFEYASIDVMEKAVQVIIGIAQEVTHMKNNKKKFSSFFELNFLFILFH